MSRDHGHPFERTMVSHASRLLPNHHPMLLEGINVFAIRLMTCRWLARADLFPRPRAHFLTYIPTSRPLYACGWSLCSFIACDQEAGGRQGGPVPRGACEQDWHYLPYLHSNLTVTSFWARERRASPESDAFPENTSSQDLCDRWVRAVAEPPAGAWAITREGAGPCSHLSH